jgi:hypothetical protein
MVCSIVFCIAIGIAIGYFGKNWLRNLIAGGWQSLEIAFAKWLVVSAQEAIDHAEKGGADVTKARLSIQHAKAFLQRGHLDDNFLARIDFHVMCAREAVRKAIDALEK